jgi:hypothetical protein
MAHQCESAINPVVFKKVARLGSGPGIFYFRLFSLSITLHTAEPQRHPMNPVVNISKTCSTCTHVTHLFTTFTKLPLYTLAGFDLTTHGSLIAGGDETTRPRRHARATLLKVFFAALLLSQPALFVKNMYTHTYMYVVGILI